MNNWNGRLVPLAAVLAMLVLCPGCSGSDGDADADTDADTDSDTDSQSAVTINGRVLDAGSSQPVSGVVVRLLPTSETATTNDQGQYTIATDVRTAQEYRLHFLHDEFVPQVLVWWLEPGENTVADVSLVRYQATIKVEPSAIDLGALGEQATIVIDDLGDRHTALTWSVTTTDDWLTVSPAQGQVTDRSSQVTLTANRALLGAQWGEHSATIQFTSNGGSATVAVTLRHVNPADQQLVVSEAAIDFGEVDVARSLRLENVGDAVLAWELTAVPAFVEVPATSGQVAPQDFVILGLYTDRRPLAAGAFNEDLVIASDSVGQGEFTVPVSLTVSDLAVPAVDVTELDFGEQDTQHSFTLYNRGKGTLSYSIDWPLPAGSRNLEGCDDRPRVWTTPYEGQVPPDGSAMITVDITRSGLRPRQYVEPLAIEGGELDRAVYAAFRVPERAQIRFWGATRIVARGSEQLMIYPYLDDWLATCAESFTNVALNWTIDTGVDWLTATPSSGRTDVMYLDESRIMQEPVDPARVTLTVDWDALGDREAEHLAPLTVTSEAGEVLHEIEAVVPPMIQREVARFSGGPAVSSVRLASAFDPFNNRLIAHGATDPDDADRRLTFVWDGADWQMHVIADGPYVGQHFSYADMVFDRARGLAVMVTRELPDAMATWEWDGAAWSKAASPIALPLRSIVNLTYDERRNRVVLFAGGSSGEADDVWTYDGADWTQQKTGVLGVAHYDGALTYDAGRDLLIYAGGRQELAGVGWDAVDEFFLVDAGSFELIAGPLPGVYGQMTGGHYGGQLRHNPRQSRTLFYGPCGAAGCNGLLYGLDDTVWSDDPEIQVIDERGVYEGLAYDPVLDRMLFAGWDGGALRVLELTSSRQPMLAPALALQGGTLALGQDTAGEAVLTNDAAGWCVYRVVPDDAWLSAAPRAGDLPPYGRRTLQVSADTAGLGSGTHSGTITVLGPPGQQAVLTVEVEVP